MTQDQKTPAPDGRVADAVAKNWVDRFCPRATRPYLRLSRADRPIGTWLLLLPCWWGLSLAWLLGADQTWAHMLWLFIAFGGGAFLMRGAGCTWNDIADRKLDAQVTRTQSRPLPSGQVSTLQAYIWLFIQTTLAAVILLQFNPFAIWVGLASLIPVVIYPFAKRFTWWPQVFLGIAFNWGALLSWAVIYGRIDWPAIGLYLAGIAWTLFYDTIYAHQDKEDDALIGIKSTARLFGASTHRWLAAFALIAVAFLIMAVALRLDQLQTPLALLGAIGAIAGFALHLFWQYRVLDINDPQNCLDLFRSNRDAGLIVVFGFLLGLLIAP